MSSTEFLTWLSSPVVLIFLTHVFGPIPVWALLALPFQIFVDRPRKVLKCLGIGALMMAIPYPVLYLLTMVVGPADIITQGVANFIVNTGGVLIGWGLSASITNPFNKWFARQHAARLEKQYKK